MNLLKSYEHENVTIQLYQYNNKYILKIEKGLFEQAFKIGETDVFDYDDFEKMIKPEVIENAMLRFEEMEKDWNKLINK